MEEKLIMSKKEVERIRYIGMAIEGKITQTKASELMKVSYRQTKRIIRKVKKQGIEAIIHGNRGKESPKKIKEEMKNKIAEIYTTKYRDFSPKFASEKLFELHNIKLSSETMRKILIEKGVWIVKSRKQGHIHLWRERKHHLGEMLQIDGSHHRWLEDRLDQEFCLIAFIDDATNRIYAKFYEYEGTLPILDIFVEYSKEHGFPYSVYLDKHSTYKTNRQASVDEELREEQPKTQFEKVMDSIDVEVIHALSPQAKGRIERLFQTLQDRLVKEMRLANICTIKDANLFLKEYIKKHNRMFSVQPKKETTMFKKVDVDFNYKWMFCITDNRIIGKDFTIRWKNRVFLVNNPLLSMKGRNVRVKQALDGTLRFETKTKILSVTEITDKDIRLLAIERKRIKPI